MRFEIDRISKIIKEKGYRLVAIQLPEGLKHRAIEIADKIQEEVNCEIVISSNPCYGACDIADDESRALGCDALFHFGHSEMVHSSIPVHYIEVRLDADLPRDLKICKKVGLVTTVQYIHTLNKIKHFLEEKGFEVYIGKAGGRVKYDGQVLGCSFFTARSISGKVDCFLYIGNGEFHPLGVSLATGKPTFVFDPILKEIREISEFKDRIIRQRFAQISKAKNASVFGILIGEKKGQSRKALALKIKKKLEEHGKKAYLISIREIVPEHFLGLKIDAFVNTACPRIPIDDALKYKQAFLTPKELEIVLGERKWEEYQMDEL